MGVDAYLTHSAMHTRGGGPYRGRHGIGGVIRKPRDFHRMRRDFGTLTTCPIGPLQWDRALEIYGLLADRGPLHQRQVGHADLLIAAAAEAAGVPVLHYDADFDLITEASGIDTRWVRPRGTLAG